MKILAFLALALLAGCDLADPHDGPYFIRLTSGGKLYEWTVQDQLGASFTVSDHRLTIYGYDDPERFSLYLEWTEPVSEGTYAGVRSDGGTSTLVQIWYVPSERTDVDYITGVNDPDEPVLHLDERNESTLRGRFSGALVSRAYQPTLVVTDGTFFVPIERDD